MKTIKTKQHPVYIGDDSLALVEKHCKPYSKRFVLVDENTKKHCLPFLKKIITAPYLIQIKSGEKKKDITSCTKIWEELSKQNADRNSLLINLGGGVISDLGGFAASTFKRGIDCINIPTTLLAQVDASVGGKTGIDFNSFKNQIGTFSFPKAVFIYPSFLNTLDKRQLLSGYAEVIKHALIADKSYWKNISKLQISSSSIEPLIYRSVEIKNKIVAADPFEKKERKKLNFGHTIGHAIESALLNSKNPLLHGEAIAIGMICESYLSRKINNFNSKDLNTITDFIINLYNLHPISLPFSHMKKIMLQDKKNIASEINFTLLKSIGQSTVDNVCSLELVEESISYFNQICK